MRRFYFLILTGIQILFIANAQDLQTPAPSPLGTVTQIVGVTEVSVSYSRPGIKERDIFGSLVPFGELWRTGANRSTTIKFSDDVRVEGLEVPKGEYALFTIPGKNEWTIIFSKDIGSGTSDYKQEDDVARFTTVPVKLDKPVERFTIEIADITDNSARINLRWAKTEVTFSFTVDTDSKVMAQIDQLMKKPDLKNANIFFQASYYYFNNDKDIKKALQWAKKAAELQPDGYWILRLQSQIQAKTGDYKEAIKTAELSMNAAKKAGNDQYVRYNTESIAEWKSKL